jgi:hypothetical protein
MTLLGSNATLRVVHHTPILVDNSIRGKFANISPKLIVVGNLLLGETTILKEKIRRMISKVVPTPVEKKRENTFRGECHHVEHDSPPSNFFQGTRFLA